MSIREVIFKYENYMIHTIRGGVTYFYDLAGLKFTFETLDKCLDFIDEMKRGV